MFIVVPLKPYYLELSVFVVADIVPVYHEWMGIYWQAWQQPFPLLAQANAASKN